MDVHYTCNYVQKGLKATETKLRCITLVGPELMHSQ